MCEKKYQKLRILFHLDQVKKNLFTQYLADCLGQMVFFRERSLL